MWDEYAKNPDNALEWQTQYQKFMFDLEDASGDGSIDIDEFTSVCSCYGLDASECKEAFNKIAGVSIHFLLGSFSTYKLKFRLFHIVQDVVSQKAFE